MGIVAFEITIARVKLPEIDCGQASQGIKVASPFQQTRCNSNCVIGN
jgi:hypothetical protein